MGIIVPSNKNCDWFAVDEIVWLSNKGPGRKNPKHMLMLHCTFIPSLVANYFTSWERSVAKTFAVYIQVYFGINRHRF